MPKTTEPMPNCITIKEFYGAGDTFYRPGIELTLGAILLENWLRLGLVKLIERPEQDKKKRKKRTVKANTAVMI